MLFFMYLTGSSKRRKLVRYLSEKWIHMNQVRRLWIGLRIPVLIPERTLLISAHLSNSVLSMYMCRLLLVIIIMSIHTCTCFKTLLLFFICVDNFLFCCCCCCFLFFLLCR